MKIAVSSTGGSMDAMLNERFGRCEYFIIYDSETEKFDAVSNLGEQMQGGAGPKAAELIKKYDADVIITGNIGDKAETALNKANIKIAEGYSGSTKVKEAIEKFIGDNA